MCYIISYRLTASPEFRAWKKWKQRKNYLQIVGKVLLFVALVSVAVIVRLSAGKYLEAEKAEHPGEKMEEKVSIEGPPLQAPLCEAQVVHALDTEPHSYPKGDAHTAQSDEAR